MEPETPKEHVDPFGPGMGFVVKHLFCKWGRYCVDCDAEGRYDSFRAWRAKQSPENQKRSDAKGASGGDSPRTPPARGPNTPEDEEGL